MSDPLSEPWTLYLVYKLLHGDRGTLRLLDHNPFSERPPRYIRAELYRYHLAPLGDRAWWRREHLQTWLPPLRADDPGLRALLRQEGFLDEKSP